MERDEGGEEGETHSVPGSISISFILRTLNSVFESAATRPKMVFRFWSSSVLSSVKKNLVPADELGRPNKEEE